MDEKIEQWKKEFELKDLKLVGYRGGFPMIEFEKNKLKKDNKREIDKIVRRAEMSAGMELGVGLNFRKTAFVIINENTVVVCGYETIIQRILENIYLQNVINTVQKTSKKLKREKSL